MLAGCADRVPFSTRCPGLPLQVRPPRIWSAPRPRGLAVELSASDLLIRRLATTTILCFFPHPYKLLRGRTPKPVLEAWSLVPLPACARSWAWPSCRWSPSAAGRGHPGAGAHHRPEGGEGLADDQEGFLFRGRGILLGPRPLSYWWAANPRTQWLYSGAVRIDRVLVWLGIALVVAAVVLAALTWH